MMLEERPPGGRVVIIARQTTLDGLAWLAENLDGREVALSLANLDYPGRDVGTERSSDKDESALWAAALDPHEGPDVAAVCAWLRRSDVWVWAEPLAPRRERKLPRTPWLHIVGDDIYMWPGPATLSRRRLAGWGR